MMPIILFLMGQRDAPNQKISKTNSLINQSGAKLLYWRVLAQDSSENEQISQARHIYVLF